MKHYAYLYLFAAAAAFLGGCSGGGNTMVPGSGSTSSNTSGSAASGARIASRGIAPEGGLDCNGLSTIQRPIKEDMVCADFFFGSQGRGEDNGRYIGHDEPSIGFYSQSRNSGNNMQWAFRLSAEHSLPATQTFENLITFWFSLAVCDPNSYPQNPCTPDSDANAGAADPHAAGSALVELQFYPPGFSPFIKQISCDLTHWCAALNIDSLECSLNFAHCNNGCIEPVNFAFVQTDGVPVGPPGPGNQTKATFTPNGRTLLMNQNDLIRVTIKDTPQGMVTRIEDLSTGQSGFIVASAANGFQNTDLQTCGTSPFTFRPEFGTAKLANIVPWTALQANVNLAVEIGHFTPGRHGDTDRDDQPCFPGPTLPGCLNFKHGGDIDFDGSSYLVDWPDGTANNATPLQYSSVLGRGIGPVSGPSGTGGPYINGYGLVQFETDVPASESTCTPSGAGCVVPPQGAAFYPFYALSSVGGRCLATFGNDIAGQTINDLGKDAQYGSSNVAWFFGTNSGGIIPNPCAP
ncbi:MAG: hypothetical protein ACXWNJ_08630 [Vulcanimicrobiaceae bacterium]